MTKTPEAHALPVEFALFFAELGVPVFLGKPSEKRPLGKLHPNGFKNATTDPALIRSWFNQHPDANVLGATGHVMDVLDIDDLDAFRRSYPGFVIPEAAMVVATPGGGQHIYFASGDIPETTKKLVGADTKGGKGYIVLPGSFVTVKPDSKAPFGSRKERGYSGPYEIIQAGDLGSLPPFPNELREVLAQNHIARSKDGASSPNRLEKAIAKERRLRSLIEAGRRNEHVFKALCAYRGQGFSSNELSRLVQEINKRCKPPLEEDELAAIVQQAGSYPSGLTERSQKNGTKGNGDLALELFVDAGGEFWIDQAEVPHGTFHDPRTRRLVNVPIASDSFLDCVEFLHFEATGRPLSKDKRETTKSTCRALAKFKGARYETAYRVGATGTGTNVILWHDLNDAQGRVIRIDADGWSVVQGEECPIRFVTSAQARALPLPASGGNPNDLSRFVNAGSDELSLVWAFLVSFFQPKGAVPILAVVSGEGTGKSTALRVIKQLLDPSEAVHRSLPAKPEDFAAELVSNPLPIFDNLSSLSNANSDVLCKISSGGTLSGRKFHTNMDSYVVCLRRSFVIGSIGNVVSQRDLASRCLFISLNRLSKNSRKSEEEFWVDFELTRPQLLGALYDRLVQSLRARSTAKIASPVRLADFYVWAVSAAGEEHLTLDNALHRSNDEFASSMLDEDVVVSALVALIDQRGEEFTIKTSELFRNLQCTVGKRYARFPRDFPESAQALGHRLIRVQSLLQEAGYQIQRLPGRREGTTYRLGPRT